MARRRPKNKSNDDDDDDNVNMAVVEEKPPFLTGRMWVWGVASLAVGYAILFRFLFADDAGPPPLEFGTGQMFDVIAPRYDLVNRVMSLQMDMDWRKRLVDELAVRVRSYEEHARPHLLDVSTGTADVAILLAQTIPHSTILGVDPSENMLELGRQKVAEIESSSSIELVKESVEKLGNVAAPKSFHGATMAFGIRNVVAQSRKDALCNIHRTLVPGGTFGILEFSEPTFMDHGIMGLLAKYAIRYVIPVLGALVSGQPREYLHLQNSIKHFPTPAEFVQQLESLDCSSSISAGSFRVDDLIHMNFGSVQLYILTAIKISKRRSVKQYTRIE
mmetsp:Transcript_22538/g.51987  ORF Transcript_22538/g.51987 Transcript_22538/m.51987 type:complete len:332 (-) Transcript_22538:265-1260(-)